VRIVTLMLVSYLRYSAVFLSVFRA
jgi:hypothetical protein